MIQPEHETQDRIRNEQRDAQAWVGASVLLIVIVSAVLGFAIDNYWLAAVMVLMVSGATTTGLVALVFTGWTEKWLGKF